MDITNAFFFWFFYGLGGLGGWFLFFLLALAAVIWLLYDSGTRHLSATGWKIAIILISLLILPAILYRFTIDPLDPNAFTKPLFEFDEPIFYLGLLAGVLPPVLAIGYYVTYQGLKGCLLGHPPYEARFGECPVCKQRNQPPVVVAPQPYQPPARQTPEVQAAPLRPQKPAVQAWLTCSDGHTYQLYQGETTIGRSSDNDIQLAGDVTVHRHHVKVIEQNGHFKLVDVAGKNNTRVNGHIVRQPVLLEHGDVIVLGDNTQLSMVTGQR